eukprot:jgi/Botrbrau1/3090/Bobra.0070s0076.1
MRRGRETAHSRPPWSSPAPWQRLCVRFWPSVGGRGWSPWCAPPLCCSQTSPPTARRVPPLLKPRCWCSPLGRLAVLLEGEQAFLGWILPLLQDADLTAAPPQVPACMMHVLSTLAGVAAHADSWWAYEKILALMSVVYKSARTAPWMYLMYRSSTTLTGCPGAVATAFLHLAQQLKGASLKYRQDYRAKLLTLFADMGGLAPPDEDSWGWDLGALLPAVAAIGQLLSTESHQKRLLSRTLSYGLTFEALVQLQEQDVALVKLFRLLVDVHIAVQVCGRRALSERYAWDPTWRSVVGTIAVTTPPIVVSSGASVDGEKLESELGERAGEYGGGEAEPLP